MKHFFAHVQAPDAAPEGSGLMATVRLVQLLAMLVNTAHKPPGTPDAAGPMVRALTQLPPEELGALAVELRSLLTTTLPLVEQALGGAFELVAPQHGLTVDNYEDRITAWHEGGLREAWYADRDARTRIEVGLALSAVEEGGVSD